MADTNEQNESPGGEELAPDRVAELESLLAQKDEALGLADARTAELEQAVTTLESEAAALKESITESEQRLADVTSALSQAIASYKARVIEANPEIPVDLIAGDNIEAIDNSLENARALISKVREVLEAELRAARIPAGAPPRTPVDLSALSPREKIQYAIGGFSS